MTKTNDTTEQATHAATDAITLSGGDEALAKLRATLDAIPAHAVTPFRAQVPEAVAAIIQNAQSYAADRARFVATFAAAAFDPAAHDNLVVRAQATWQADLLYRRATDPEGLAAELIAAAKPLRQRILRAASYLWGHDDVIAPQLAHIREGQGHLDTADDLAALAGLFSANWSTAKGRCDITEADVTQAQNISVKLVNALAAKSDDREVIKARDLRDRAATYARYGVDTIRAAAGFIFRDDEAALDRYPTIFVSRGRRRPTAPKSAPTTVAPASPAPATPIAPR
ncbi:MAG: hypothetical protein HYY84_12555 [Deltaproteobacteria bacterium]|nr:hypothetical protein [Deltaproteobacteria bacterium]